MAIVRTPRLCGSRRRCVRTAHRIGPRTAARPAPTARSARCRLRHPSCFSGVAPIKPRRRPMSTIVQPERVKDAPPPPDAKAPAPAEAERPSDAWAGDGIAMAVWMSAALIIAFLLLKDVIFAVLFGRS